MHYLLCPGQSEPERGEVSYIDQAGVAGFPHDQDGELKQDADDSKIYGETEARFSEVKPIPICLHRPQTERQVGDPEENPSLS